MITLHALVQDDHACDDELALPFERRQHSRLRATLASGREVALFLPRGTILRGGDRLRGEDPARNEVRVRVVAAPESLHRVTGHPLIRAAYHLGNRHVPVELGDGFLRLERDAVLREMLVGLGFEVAEELAPFEPEPGAYGGGHRHRGHDDDHAHEHEHEHEHEH